MIKLKIDEMKYGQEITFLEKLKHADQYLKAIRYSLKRPTVFLKKISLWNQN